MIVTTTLGPLDDSLLIKRENVIETDNERTTSVEYCLKGCINSAHITNQPHSEMYFCPQHVHRSVHVTLKRVQGLESALGSFC